MLKPQYVVYQLFNGLCELPVEAVSVTWISSFGDSQEMLKNPIDRPFLLFCSIPGRFCQDFEFATMAITIPSSETSESSKSSVALCEMPNNETSCLATSGYYSSIPNSILRKPPNFNLESPAYRPPPSPTPQHTQIQSQAPNNRGEPCPPEPVRGLCRAVT